MTATDKMTLFDPNRVVSEMRFVHWIDDPAEQDRALTSLAARIVRQVASDKIDALIERARAEHPRRRPAIGTA